VFFHAQEENGDDEENGEKHLYEQALRDGSAATKARTCGQGSGEECAGNTGGGDAADNLDEYEEGTTQGRDSPDEDKRERGLCSITVRSFQRLNLLFLVWFLLGRKPAVQQSDEDLPPDSEEYPRAHCK
jgi:hypothetical protein